MNPWLALRDALRPARRPPAGGAKEAWIHHGARAAIVLLISLSVIWIFPGTSISGYERIEVGSVADQDVIAEFGFEVPKSEAQIAEEERAALAAVPTYVSVDRAPADSSRAELREIFAQLDSIVPALGTRAAAEGLEGEDRAEFLREGTREALASFGIAFLTDEQIDYLLDGGRRARLLAALEEAFEELLDQGAIRASDLQGGRPEIVVIRGDGTDRSVPLSSIPMLDELQRRLNEQVADDLPQVGATIFGPLMVRYAQPTHRLALEDIRRAREQAVQSVGRTQGYVFERERIITQNEPVSEVEYERLQAYVQAQLERGFVGLGTGFWRGLGMVILAFSLLGTLVFATYTFRRDIYEDLRSFSVLLGLIVVVVIVSGIVAAAEAPASLIPVALAGLLAAALFDSLLGVVVVSTIAGILLGQPAFEGLPVPMLSVAGGVTAAFAVGRVRTRSQSWVLIALISGAYVIVSLCLLLLDHFSWGDVAVHSLIGAGNATVCTALAMGAILPALEAFTGRTTEQTLLELADMNRPLLRRLAREAPGTYAHSINLANLVEAACEAIGADAVLGRVGVYYHDIGKLHRPQYFIENQPKGLNPHDRLRPQESAEILREHVREGLKMAEEARLPEVVRAFIREHHGTQQIKYFLHRARERGEDQDLDPNDFAYPGPKPQSKETAIAMLGDAVESASRTLAEPSPEGIRGLIERLVSARVEEGELDECGLTFRDLNLVKQAFAHVLTGLYHHRIDYPKPSMGTEAAAEGEAAPGYATLPPGSPLSGPDEGGSGPGTASTPRGVGGGPAGPNPQQMTIDLDPSLPQGAGRSAGD